MAGEVIGAEKFKELNWKSWNTKKILLRFWKLLGKGEMMVDSAEKRNCEGAI